MKEVHFTLSSCSSTAIRRLALELMLPSCAKPRQKSEICFRLKITAMYSPPIGQALGK